MSRGGLKGVWRVSLWCLKNVLRVSGDTVKVVWSQDRPSEVKSGHVKSSQIRSGQLRSSQEVSNQDRGSKDRSF